jgi:hypothetical protein
MSADPVVRPGSGVPGDITLTGSGPRVRDIYLSPTSPVVLSGQRLDRLDPAEAGGGGTVTATAAVDLGGLSVTATATVTHPATASITLGTATVAAEAAVTVPASASISLSGASITATGTVTHPATSTVNLGGLSVTVTVASTPPDDGGSSHSAGGDPKPRRFPDPVRLPRIPNVIHATAQITSGLTITAIATAEYDWQYADEELLLLI